jgi:hypothetical protein
MLPIVGGRLIAVQMKQLRNSWLFTARILSGETRKKSLELRSANSVAAYVVRNSSSTRQEGYVPPTRQLVRTLLGRYESICQGPQSRY